jgi:hypothetical protein
MPPRPTGCVVIARSAPAAYVAPSGCEQCPVVPRRATTSGRLADKPTEGHTRMKRLLATLLLLLGLAPLAVAADLQAELMAQEQSLWTAWGKKDGAPFKKHLTADAVEIIAGTAPAIGLDAIVKDIATHTCEMKSFAHQNPKLRKLGADVVVLTYTATQDTTCDGKKLPAKLFATTIYVRQKGTWMQTQYQETPID